MTTPQEGTRTCCEHCEGYLHHKERLCPCHSPKEVQESTEEWEQDLRDNWPLAESTAITAGDWVRLENWIREKKALWDKENSNYYLDEAEKEITHARTLVLQEAAATIRELTKPKSYWSSPWWREDEIAYNQALEDAAQKIEALYKDKT